MLNQDDFNKIEKGSSKAKQVDGMVYSSKKGTVNFNHITSLPVLDGATLGETITKIFENQNEANTKLMEKLEILKDILLKQEERIASLEIKIAKYGIE